MPNGAVGFRRGRWSAAVVLAAAVTLFADEEYFPITSVVAEPLRMEHWHDVLEVPAGTVKYASWGDLRMEIEHRPEVVTMQVFVVSEEAKLPQRGAEPKKPVLVPDRRALDERKDWRPVSVAMCRTINLAQGKSAVTQQVLVVGVDASPDKKGGAVLYWRFGLPPRQKHPIFEPWAPADVPVIIEDRWHAKDLKPRVIPCMSAKKEETVLVLRKGKRIAAIVRYQPAVAGGDPWARFYIAVDAEAEHVVGDVALTEERSTKATLEFKKDHGEKEYDPKNTALELTLDGHVFMVTFETDPKAGAAYAVYEKPGL